MPKVIVVAGGSDGLGKEIAKQLAGKHQVILLAHNPPKLEKTAHELSTDFVAADVTDFAQVEEAVSNVVAKYQRIDVLINSAGIWTEGLITQNTAEEINEIVDVNTKGVIFLCKAIIPVMEKQAGGEIINIISQDGLCAKPNRSLYHASKWAITGFTRCLQLDLSSKNIKVTGVYPGLMKTGLFKKQGVQRNLENALDLSEVAKLVGFVIDLKQDTLIPEIGIRNLLNTTKNMDDSQKPDTNLDPNQMAGQGQSPTAVPSASNIKPLDAPSTADPSVIDITPKNSPASDPTSTPTPTPAASTPTPPADPMPSTPADNPAAPPNPLAMPTTAPEPAAIQPKQMPSSTPPVGDNPAAPPNPLAMPTTAPEPATVQPKQMPSSTSPVTGTPSPASPTTPTPTPPTGSPSPSQKQGGLDIDKSSPLYENPDDVKLKK